MTDDSQCEAGLKGIRKLAAKYKSLPFSSQGKWQLSSLHSKKTQHHFYGTTDMPYEMTLSCPCGFRALNG